MTKASPEKFKKEKAGFWCPEDVDAGIKRLLAAGAYQDRSKAIVALLREALRDDRALPDPLQRRIEELAVLLDRSPDTILASCVEGMIGMIETGNQPLLVAEVRLRQKRLPFRGGEPRA